jgi:DNA primase
MDYSGQRTLWEEVKSIDLVDYLATLGFEPVRVRSDDYWYLSPLRTERTASFKVNRRINCWYDHGIGKGGGLIDFAMEYEGCTIGELMQRLQGHLSIPQPDRGGSHSGKSSLKNAIHIIQVQPLHSFPLTEYLKQRKIPIQLARRYCRELDYTIRDKSYFGIGFPNDSGGYEIRNPYFKGGSSPKDITHTSLDSDTVDVFEGFMDFLSFQAIRQQTGAPGHDTAILNSLALFERARPFMEMHKRICLFLDRDDAGERYSKYAQSLSTRYRDESGLYAGHKDLNEWLMDFGHPKSNRLGFRHR